MRTRWQRTPLGAAIFAERDTLLWRGRVGAACYTVAYADYRLGTGVAPAPAQFALTAAQAAQRRAWVDTEIAGGRQAHPWAPWQEGRAA